MCHDTTATHTHPIVHTVGFRCRSRFWPPPGDCSNTHTQHFTHLRRIWQPSSPQPHRQAVALCILRPDRQDRVTHCLEPRRTTRKLQWEQKRACMCVLYECVLCVLRQTRGSIGLLWLAFMVPKRALVASRTKCASLSSVSGCRNSAALVGASVCSSSSCIWLAVLTTSLRSVTSSPPSLGMAVTVCVYVCVCQ